MRSPRPDGHHHGRTVRSLAARYAATVRMAAQTVASGAARFRIATSGRSPLSPLVASPVAVADFRSESAMRLLILGVLLLVIAGGLMSGSRR
jgi:hypothetical protein